MQTNEVLNFMDVSFYHDFVDLYLTELLSLLMSCSDGKAIKLLAPAKP